MKLTNPQLSTLHDSSPSGLSAAKCYSTLLITPHISIHSSTMIILNILPSAFIISLTRHSGLPQQVLGPRLLRQRHGPVLL
jgi:hypothetical protein